MFIFEEVSISSIITDVRIKVRWTRIYPKLYVTGLHDNEITTVHHGKAKTLGNILLLSSL